MTDSPSNTPDDLGLSERGFGVNYSTDTDDEGVRWTWADLTAGEGRVAAPKYGRGTDEATALASARHRVEVEQ